MASKETIRYYSSVPDEVEDFHRNRYIQAIELICGLTMSKTLSIKQLNPILDRYPPNLRHFLRGLIYIHHKPIVEGCSGECDCPVHWHNPQTLKDAIYRIRTARTINLLRAAEADGFDLKVPKEIPRPSSEE